MPYHYCDQKSSFNSFINKHNLVFLAVCKKIENVNIVFMVQNFFEEYISCLCSYTAIQNVVQNIHFLMLCDVDISYIYLAKYSRHR